MEFNYRLGNFFILLGLGAIFFFWLTTQGENATPEGNFLVIGLASLIFGIWRSWTSRPKPQQVERFTTLRKLFTKKEKKKKK
ncbi:MAG: hypothetical protein H6636_04040 [Anaerolineales bacterium]|nr:hypothetical protein [Anaerolineales bacterium]